MNLILPVHMQFFNEIVLNVINNRNILIMFNLILHFLNVIVFLTNYLSETQKCVFLIFVNPPTSISLKFDIFYNFSKPHNIRIYIISALCMNTFLVNITQIPSVMQKWLCKIFWLNKSTFKSIVE